MLETASSFLALPPISGKGPFGFCQAHLLVCLHEGGPGFHNVVADGALAQGSCLVETGLPTGGQGLLVDTSQQPAERAGV